jgi:two-component system, OmpR family, response regulator
LFPGNHIAVEVVAVKGNVVRLGIQAPPDVTVLREELHDRLAEGGTAEAQRADRALPAQLRELYSLLRNRLRVTGRGLTLSRQQLQSGLPQDAAATLEEVEDDLVSLLRRFEKEVTKASPPAPVKSLQSRKALLVEDNANERTLLATFLRSSGLDVDAVGDGTDALDYLHTKDRPDVVLLDMGLPRCDGPTTVHEIRRDPALAGLKIFAVTGHLPEEFNLDRGPRGIDRWFRKPLDLTTLVHDLDQDLACAGV